MVSPELLIDAADDVDQWVNTNLNNIVAAMKKAHENKVAEQIRDYSGISSGLEIWRRAYSEMKLCGVWDLLKPPEGFEIISWEIGQVNIIAPLTNLPIYTDHHIYAINPDGVILCITPGQFKALTRTDLYAGDRLQLLKNQAPSLISLYFDDQNRFGIGTLVGTREEIVRGLNFDYTVVG